ncbi:LysR family transcriptional regulator [Nocardia sp. CDC160]|uniref:LysR family transcriptional regulator n=1 Tax=Nocardia sp. CDC160 TaxID=3112166 RepID=UPI002DB8DF26|nr:LysR family transcriptional regulator [Nocardia sp. CDC160]MEC3916641.1 LysR family transcriptional regulator [Nocardia sp. CDC160]
MDLLQLRYFRMVARTENITRVAEELRVAQPSLSRTITRLESELGVPLFDRQGRRLRLNRFGTAFLARVDRALDELDSARRELADLAEEERGSVAVGAENLMVVQHVVADFVQAYPGVRVQLFSGTTEQVVARLTAGEIDLGLVSRPIAEPGIAVRELLDEEVLLAVSPRHRLANRDRVTVAELADEPFITTSPDYWQRRVLDRVFCRAGLRPNIACEGDEPAAIRNLVATGFGVGLLPSMASEYPGPPVAWLHIDDVHCRRTLHVCWREDAYLPLAAGRFREMAAERFARSQPGRPGPE